MPKVLVSDTNLTNIAEAIRFKYHGATTSYTPAAMAPAIRNISPLLESITITPTENEQHFDCIKEVEVLSITNQTTSINTGSIMYALLLPNVVIESNKLYNINLECSYNIGTLSSGTFEIKNKKIQTGSNFNVHITNNCPNLKYLYFNNGQAYIQFNTGFRNQTGSLTLSCTITELKEYKSLSTFQVNEGDEIFVHGSVQIAESGSMRNSTPYLVSSTITRTTGTQTVLLNVEGDSTRKLKVEITDSTKKITYCNNNGTSVENNFDSGELSKAVYFYKYEEIQNEGWDDITVEAIPSQYIVPSGTFTVTTNNIYDIKNYASVNVAVVGPTPNFQSKTVTPSTVTQVIQADSNYDALDIVTVEPIPAGYTVPAGTITITASGTYNVTNYASANVQVSGGGSAPTLQTKTVTPSTATQTITPDANYDGLDKVVVNAMPTGSLASPTISISNNGVITATSSLTTAGYIAQNATSQNTLTLPTVAAATITPSTVPQSIGAAGRYMLGTVTIQGDPDLVPANIAAGVNIFGVTGTLAFVNYFSGTATPAASLGNNGDLYFQMG